MGLYWIPLTILSWVWWRSIIFSFLEPGSLSTQWEEHFSMIASLVNSLLRNEVSSPFDHSSGSQVRCARLLLINIVKYKSWMTRRSNGSPLLLSVSFFSHISLDIIYPWLFRPYGLLSRIVLVHPWLILYYRLFINPSFYVPKWTLVLEQLLSTETHDLMVQVHLVYLRLGLTTPSYPLEITYSSDDGTLTSSKENFIPLLTCIRIGLVPLSSVPSNYFIQGCRSASLADNLISGSFSSSFYIKFLTLEDLWSQYSDG